MMAPSLRFRPWHVAGLALAAALAVAASCSAGEAGRAAPDRDPPVGGANAPPPAPPPGFVIQTAELDAGGFAVKVPTGTYTAPAGGAPNYTVPGPIAAFKGPDGAWRGHGYLETYPRLVTFEGKVEKASAHLVYTFEGGESYEVRLTVKGGAVLMDETSDLGPRNLYVFDCYYGGWLPSAGFALDLGARNHAFLYLPCHYDQAEVNIQPAKLEEAGAAAGVAVVSPADEKNDVAGFWCRDTKAWRNADAMGIQLWQHRQMPGDPGSRHFLGPETKSDSTPNPRTAPMLGRSLYEGHVTIEMALGAGTRKLGFAAAGKGNTKASVPEALKTIARANP